MVELLPEGEIGRGAEGEFDCWSVEPRGVNKTPTLEFFNGAKLVFTTTLDHAGNWKGRDRTKGTVMLRPITKTPDRWKQLADPVRFSQTQAHPDVDLPDGFAFSDKLAAQIDWAPYQYNLADQLDQSKLVKAKTAVALIGYNRPTYFGQMLNGLKQNPEIHKLPVFAFMDRTTPEQETTTQAQRELLKEHLPHAIIITRPITFGCGRNIIDARRQLFDNLQYERVWVFEDDFVPGPNYLGVVTRLLDWGETNYGNVGATQGWAKCHKSVDEKRAVLRQVCGTHNNWWGYLMSKRAWAAISARIYRYEELFLGSRDYGTRPHSTIARWFSHLRRTAPLELPGPKYPVDEATKKGSRGYFQAPPTGQDAVTMITFEQAGFVRLATVVNRGVYVGQQGIHMNPGQFRRAGYHNVEYDDFPEDRQISAFTPRGVNPVAPEPEPEPADENIPEGIGRPADGG
jgi:hypothetical protein